jgi:hypothetical protein
MGVFLLNSFFILENILSLKFTKTNVPPPWHMAVVPNRHRSQRLVL